VRSSLEYGLKHLALTLLPHRLVYWLWHLRRRNRPRTGDDNAVDVRVVPVREGARLEVYWNTNPLGPGPAASLYVLEEEVLRLDCFGGETGHMHINPVQVNLALPWEVTPRYFFPPDTLENHIERSVFELTTNSKAALQTNLLGRVRMFPIEHGCLVEAAGRMRSEMYELLAKHAEGRVAAKPSA
jgi:hypothetical protein